MWKDFGVAFALILVIEGMMPFINPTSWRESLRKISEMDDKLLRIIGFFSMIFGVMLLYILHSKLI